MNQVIQLDGILSEVETDEIQVYSSTTIVQLSEQLDDAIDSNSIVSELQLNFVLYPNEVISTEAFGSTQINQFVVLQSIESTIAFGNFTQLNMEIDDVPFPSIESTVIIPTPNVLKVIGPLSIGSTESVGISSFIDNIHRILVFKDDNISKVGENDATVIAGGIRLNPASTTSNNATSGSAQLPEAPVGFLSINISGIDYKIPYYNS